MLKAAFREATFCRNLIQFRSHDSDVNVTSLVGECKAVYLATSFTILLSSIRGPARLGWDCI